MLCVAPSPVQGVNRYDFSKGRVPCRRFFRARAGLNRHFAPLRVLDVKRAVGMVFTGAAEVVDTEDAHFQTYDFASWRELSALKAEFEHDQHEWIGLVKGYLAVPRVIRLHALRSASAGPRAAEPAEHLPAGRQRLPVLRQEVSDLGTLAGPRDPAFPRRRKLVDQPGCACTDCNARKGAKTPAQVGMRLIRMPRKVAEPAQLIRVQHQSWAHFVSEAYWNVELQ